MKAEIAGEAANKINTSGLSYEIIAGYKQFFTENFGLRYYAQFAMANTSGKTEGGDKAELNVMKYGVNVDALYNFVSNDSLDFGAFLGFGLGANTWSGQFVKDLKELGGSKVSTTGFDLALNVGLRSVIAKNHGIEIAVKVPFIATTLFDQSIENISFKTTASHNYNVGARYIFNF